MCPFYQFFADLTLKAVARGSEGIDHMQHIVGKNFIAGSRSGIGAASLRSIEAATGEELDCVRRLGGLILEFRLLHEMLGDETGPVLVNAIEEVAGVLRCGGGRPDL